MQEILFKDYACFENIGSDLFKSLMIMMLHRIDGWIAFTLDLVIILKSTMGKGNLDAGVDRSDHISVKIG